ncbi:MAG: DUF5121 domain-containing protein [Rikenellaceae bacterium]
MKRFLLYISALAVAMSCSEDIDVANVTSNDNATQQLTVNVAVESPETRVDVSEDGTSWVVAWNAEDILGGWATDSATSEATQFSIDASSMSGDNASFTGEIPTGVTTMRMLHPYSASQSMDSSNNISLSLAEQSVSADFSHLGANTYMLSDEFTVDAAENSASEIKMKHVGAAIELMIKFADATSIDEADYTISKVEFGQWLPVAGELNIEDATFSATAWDVVTISADNLEAVDGIYTVRFNTFPFSLSGGSTLPVTVTLTDSDSNEYIATASVDVSEDTEIERATKNTIYALLGEFEWFPLFDDEMMDSVSDNNYSIVTSLTQGSEYKITDIDNFEEWNIDSDFFARNDQNDSSKLTFLPVDGLYKVTANTEYSYLIIEPMSSESDYATYSDGGAIWLIGGGNVAKPTLTNAYSWEPDMALALAQMDDTTYQITFTAGLSMTSTTINFKFFHQKAWGGEFGADDITSGSDMLSISSDGNVNLSDGYSFEAGGIYTFTLDVSGDVAEITVAQAGAADLDTAGITINGTEVIMVDMDNYSLDIELTQGEVVAFGGDDMFTPAWINPDFFGSDYALVPLSGWYRVLLNVTDMTIDALPIDADGNLKTLDDAGNGAIYFIGWGIGSPNLASQPGWSTEYGIAVPEYTDKVYVMRGTTGADGSTTYGERFRYDWWGGKFFAERGWSGLGAFTLADGTEALLSVASDGNLELATSLEEGAAYELTVDCTEGKEYPVVSFVKVD